MPTIAPAERKHETLGEELAHKPAATGAKRRANRELTRAHRSAREQQIRDVDARDEQDQPDGAEQHQESLATVADDCVDVASHSPAHILRCRWVSLGRDGARRRRAASDARANVTLGARRAITLSDRPLWLASCSALSPEWRHTCSRRRMRRSRRA